MNIREKIARAICESLGDHPDSRWQDYLSSADAALNAIWRSMIDAAREE
jgi:hypothetical protein